MKHCPRLSVCLSVPCLRFTRNRSTVETSNLAETWPWTRVIGGAFFAVTANENAEIVIRAYVREKWMYLRNTK